MDIAWGLVLVVLGLLAWGGQTISWLAPATAARVGLSEAEAEVEPVFWADVRGEAMWDAFVLWTLPVAGLLLLVDAGAWAYLGLVGGGVYLYFGGRGILTRLAMHQRGMRIGDQQALTVNITFLALWAVAGLVTIAVAIADLDPA